MTNNKTEKNELEARRAAARWAVARAGARAGELAAIADLVRSRWPEPPDLGGERC